MKRIAMITGVFLLFLTGCKKEDTSAVCKDSEKIEKPSVLRCPKCSRQSAAEKVQSVNQHMALCPACKKVSPLMNFYLRKRK